MNKHIQLLEIQKAHNFFHFELLFQTFLSAKKQPGTSWETVH